MLSNLSYNIVIYVRINDGGLFGSMKGLRNKTISFMKGLRSYRKS